MMKTIANNMIRAVAVCLLALAGPALAVDGGKLDRGQAEQILSEGEGFFRQANDKVASDPEVAKDLYGKAVLRFERIAKEGGIENGELYYNIGNAYFRMGDIGRSILNYRRAERYISNNSDLHQNLSYARTKRMDQVEEKQETRVLKTLFFWHYDVPGRIRAIIFGTCFVLAWIFAIVRIFVRRPAINWLTGIPAVAALFLAASLAADSLAARRDMPGVIIAEETTARKGDGEAYEPSFKEPLHAGTEFLLIENRGKWYNVELADGRKCWVSASAVELVSNK